MENLRLYSNYMKKLVALISHQVKTDEQIAQEVNQAVQKFRKVHAKSLEKAKSNK